MKILVLHSAPIPNSPPEELDTLIAAQAVCAALLAKGHDADQAAFTADTKALMRLTRGYDLVFNLVEGIDGKGALAPLAQHLLSSLGMPFTGTWAANVLVNPPYTTDNSSYPAVHPANNGGDWATDVYAAEGTPVKLQVTSPDGPVTVTWESSTTSCGTSSKVDVFVNGGFVGWIFYGHVQGGRGTNTADPQPTNGTTLGTVHDYGDQALLLELSGTAEVLAWTEELRAADLLGVLDIVPASRTVLVKLAGPRYQEPTRQRLAKLRVERAQVDESTAPLHDQPDVVIDVTYDGSVPEDRLILSEGAWAQSDDATETSA